MRTEDTIAKKLISRGVDAKVDGYQNHEEDGTISLPDGHHIQVGYDYLCLIHCENDTYTYVLEECSVDQIVTYMNSKQRRTM